MKRLNFLLLPVLLFPILSCTKDDEVENIEVKEPLEIRAQKGISNQFGIYIGTAIMYLLVNWEEVAAH